MAAKTGRDLALEALVTERNHQQYGLGYALAHDDEHRPAEWVVLLLRYVARAGDAGMENDPEAYRRRLVQVGAVALAAIESLDRAAVRAR